MRNLSIRIWSPSGFCATAVLIAAGFAVVNLLGWRECTTFISQNVPKGYSMLGGSIRGLLYMGLHFATVLFVPILLLAALFSALLRRAFR